MAALRKILVCGVGLIGGSFALALRRSALGAGAEFVGMGRSRATLDAAVQLGVIDRHCSEWAEALSGVDLVLLAMPVGQMLEAFRQMAPHLEAGVIITDAGSTKQDVVVAARQGLGNKIGQFVPAHPIAGAEKSGVSAAFVDLYRDKRVVLTPLTENDAQAVACVREVWQACGARVSELTPEAHDRTFAAVSHLPHVLAFALVHEFATRPESEQLFGFAGGGFRDFTRIASSHPEMWRDICVANRAALLAELDAYQTELLKLRVLLAAGDAAGLEAMFAEARAARDAWLDTLPSPPGE